MSPDFSLRRARVGSPQRKSSSRSSRPRTAAFEVIDIGAFSAVILGDGQACCSTIRRQTRLPEPDSLWWPNPDTPDGLPYIYRDGEVNPEIRDYDRQRLDGMVWAVQTLALYAYVYNNRDAVAPAAQYYASFSWTRQRA
jgi:hypothetical protein